MRKIKNKLSKNQIVLEKRRIKKLFNKQLLDGITQCHINRCFVSTTGQINEQRLEILNTELRKRLGDWLDK